MLTSILKNLIIIFTSLYLMDKLTKSFTRSLYTFIKYMLFSLILAIIIYFCKIHIPYIAYYAPAICLIIFTCAIKRTWSLSIFCISLSSYVINLLMFHVVSLVICTLLVVFSQISFIYINEITIAICIVYPLIIMCTLKIKPVYKSISTLIFNGMINYNTAVCLIALATMTIEQVSPSDEHIMRRFRAIVIPICLIIILSWCRSQISKSYREKLRLLEIKTLRASKDEDKAYIAKLEAENKRLGAIIHKDNRIVNAMADSVCTYLATSENSDIEALHSKGLSLSNEINAIRVYRQELLNQCMPDMTSIPLTNYSGIDAIISFMTKEASSNNIVLKFNFDSTFFNSKQSTSSELDLVHLFSDLLENAIIATKHAHGRFIELSLQTLKGVPTISVSDSGIPFEIDTYMKFEIFEASTHTDEGGTGIGLMDIWSFKKKYHASLIIEEMNNTICSKRLSILFDGKNRYLIVSNRFQQIVSKQTRSDLLVINAESNKSVDHILSL